MNQELPRGAVYGIAAAIAIVVIGAFVWLFAIRGSGTMTNEDIKRAEMQAAVGNANLRRNIGNTPGGPPATGEMEARARSGGHY